MTDVKVAEAEARQAAQQSAVTSKIDGQIGRAHV